MSEPVAKQQAEIIKLQKDVETIRDNHLTHIHDCIHRVEGEMKENRKFFIERMDKLDNKIFWIMGFSVTTMLSVIVAMFGTS